MRTLLFGSIGGLIGAAAWTAVATQTEFQGGWLMCAIGVLVGIACRFAARRTPARSTAGTAAAIAFIAVILGKVGIAGVAFVSAPGEITENDLIAQIARNNIEEIQLDGGVVRWPEGADTASPDEPADFHADTWFAAARQWRAMSADRKKSFEEAYFGDQSERASGGLAAGIAALTTVSPFDALWLILTVGAAPLIACATPLRAEVFHEDPVVNLAQPSVGPLSHIPPPTEDERAHGIRGLPPATAVQPKPSARQGDGQGEQNAA